MVAKNERRRWLSIFDPLSLRGRVTLILNGTMAHLLALFLLIDFQRDFADRLKLKRTALDEQARLLEPGILGRIAMGPDAVQGFLRATVSVTARCDNGADVDHRRWGVAVTSVLRRGTRSLRGGIGFRGSGGFVSQEASNSFR